MENKNNDVFLNLLKDFLQYKKFDHNTAAGFLYELKEFVSKKDMTPDKIIEILKNSDSSNKGFVKDFFSFLLEKKGINKEEAFGFIESLNHQEIMAAWNYTEIKKSIFTFKDVITWVQDNFDENKHGGACITKESKEQKILLYACFVDTKNQPLSKFGELFLKAEADQLDDELISHFADKSMILIQ